MEKSLIIAYEDFRQELADLVNNSRLPPFIIEIVLQNYLNQIQGVARKQYQFEKEQYEKSLSEKVD